MNVAGAGGRADIKGGPGCATGGCCRWPLDSAHAVGSTREAAPAPNVNHHRKRERERGRDGERWRWKEKGD